MCTAKDGALTPCPFCFTLSHIQQSNLAVLPGGIAELLLSSREEEVLYLRKRTGFARIAHTAGVQLVPSYCFGNNQFFSQLSTSSGFVARLSRRLRMSLTVFWGQWLLPIPHQTRVTMVRESYRRGWWVVGQRLVIHACDPRVQCTGVWATH